MPALADKTMWRDIAAELTAGGLAPRLHEALAPYTTFQLGGPTPLLLDCATPDAVRQAVRVLAARGLGFTLIGDGSNLLVADAGVPDPVLRYVSDTPEIRGGAGGVAVSGATDLDTFAAWACAEGLGEMVNCSGIPGTVGGAVAGNAGAFGWQIGDCLRQVRLLARDGSERVATPAEIGFSYRHSGLRETGEIVLSVVCELPVANSSDLSARRAEILELRAGKHPDLSVDCCAGSFFRNIEPTSAAARRQAAGWFLEEAGAKAMRVGGAGVFSKHANIIIKVAPDCQARDVYELSLRMAAAVKAKFGLELSREVRLLGEFAES